MGLGLGMGIQMGSDGRFYASMGGVTMPNNAGESDQPSVPYQKGADGGQLGTMPGSTFAAAKKSLGRGNSLHGKKDSMTMSPKRLSNAG